MPRAEASVTINAPIEKVFDVVADPEQVPQYMSGVSDVSNIQGDPGEKGSSSDIAYHVMGMKFTQQMTVSEVEKPRKLLLEMKGGFPGTFQWTLEAQGQATKVDVMVDYSVPGGILGKIANQLLLERMNQKNLDGSAEKLKLLCEA